MDYSRSSFWLLAPALQHCNRCPIWFIILSNCKLVLSAVDPPRQVSQVGWFRWILPKARSPDLTGQISFTVVHIQVLWVQISSRIYRWICSRIYSRIFSRTYCMVGSIFGSIIGSIVGPIFGLIIGSKVGSIVGSISDICRIYNWIFCWIQ